MSSTSDVRKTDKMKKKESPLYWNHFHYQI